MHRTKLLLSLILALCACSPSPACGGTLYRPDADEDARPWTFWYWMHGAVSRRGITADLEAMRYEGLGGCYLMPIYGPDRAPELGGTLRQLTPEWWQMVDFALHEADRLGLKIGMHICDGFALAGGPWITPTQSMQVVVSTDTLLTLKRKTAYTEAMLPAAYEGSTDYYRDIAAYAMPLVGGYGTVTDTPRVESKSDGFEYDSATGRIKSRKACRFTLTYDRPVTVSALEITTFNNSVQALRMKVFAQADDGSLQLLKQIVPPRHGWQNYDSPTTVALPTVTTRRLCFDWTPEGSEAGSEDLDNAKWSKTLKIQSLKVISDPRIDDWEGKAGRVWRVSSAAQCATSAEAYVPADKVVRLTPGTRLGRGTWRIVRIGHTSTGHQNATGGDGKGLECDKFSARATQSQLDHWFGEAFRQCDADVARRTLRYMHIDSWECGSQNWSDSISVPEIKKQDFGKDLDFNEEKILKKNQDGNKNKGEIFEKRNKEKSKNKTQTSDQESVLNFAQWFKQRRGYDLMPYLPLMVGIPIENCETTERVLRDVRATIAELTDTVFYPTLKAEARRHGCLLSAESIAPTMTSDGMLHYRHADYPMGEFWLNSPTHDKPNDMLDAISGGHVYGKQVIQAEGFTELRGNFGETPAQLKPLLDRQYCLGINRLFFHVYAHNPDPDLRPGMTLDGIGLFFQGTQPWWPEGRSMVDYICRCQRLLQRGRPVVDVAVYTGNETPRRAILPSRLAPLTGYHYDSYNNDAILRPTASPFRPQYRVLFLPEARPMDPDRQPMPDSVKSALSRLDMTVVDGNPTVGQLQSLGIEPDAVLPADVCFAHRSTDSCEIYFISNQSGHARDLDIRLRDHKCRPAYVYDAVTATCRATAHRQGAMHLQLPAYGSRFVLFGACAETAEALPLPAGENTTAADKKEATATADSREATAPADALSTALSPKGKIHLTFESNRLEMDIDSIGFDWSTSGNDSVRYYSGRVLYSFDFEYKTTPAAAYGLRLADLHDVATIVLNGQDCGSVWTAPYEADITRALRDGHNHIEIQVANTWSNAIDGHDLGRDPFGGIWTNAKYRKASKALLPAGILGGLQIIGVAQ